MDEDELRGRERFPVSALFHENTKLGSRSMLELAERIAGASGAPPLSKRYPTRPAIALPHYKRPLLGPRLDDALRTRRSPRGPFGNARITLPVLGALLELSLGPTGDGLRAWPSAGGRYPLEAYLVTSRCAGLAEGVHHFDPHRHELRTLRAEPIQAAFGRTLVTDDPAGDRWASASAALVFTAEFERTQAKYGERGYRFVLLEAGHAAQNVALVACSLGLAALPIGGFCEDQVGALLGLDARRESPVYVLLVGGAP